jgi:hypothetical protein
MNRTNEDFEGSIVELKNLQNLLQLFEPFSWLPFDFVLQLAF